MLLTIVAPSSCACLYFRSEFLAYPNIHYFLCTLQGECGGIKSIYIPSLSFRLFNLSSARSTFISCCIRTYHSTLHCDCSCAKATMAHINFVANRLARSEEHTSELQSRGH